MEAAENLVGTIFRLADPFYKFDELGTRASRYVLLF
jgi:hypothetical protein